MKVLKRVGLLTIVLLAALFASFTVSGNIAHAEEPPTISDHVYDPGDKLGGQADKVKERLASLDRSGLHVYVAFPSEYSNETVSNWNLLALQKSGAPQGSYMLSIVADNPNQTMYLASADNAAKLSQEELSAIASEKMVPLLNQQKYPEAVLAYLDALSAKAPEMGSGLAVAPWAMIAFLVALIVVIIVISRVLRARRKAQNRTEDNASGESTEALASQDLRSQLPAFAVGTRQGGVTESEASTNKESSKTAVVDEDDHEDEQPSKGKFRLRFGQNAKSSGKSKSDKTPVDNPETAKAVSENFAGAASSQPAAAAFLQTPSTDAGLVNKEPNLTSVAGTAQVKAEEPKPAIPTGVPGTLNTSSSGKVPSLAELDQIALARTRAQTTNSTEANAGYQVSPAPQMQAPTSSQLPPQSEEPALP
ncbi:TPM domain-containing protein, partial [Varibaculum cambriense]|uniref:TPM domain-containing protein n=3 Tax=Varibaculum cambriense TaxID=184870 RepID=UPI00290497FF